MWLWFVRLFVGAAICLTYVETRGAGPAPFAPSGSSMLARILYYMFHRRCWEFFWAAHVLECAIYAMDFLEGCAWAPVWPPSLGFVQGRLLIAAISWFASACATCHEKRPKQFPVKPKSKGEVELRFILYGRRGGEKWRKFEMVAGPGGVTDRLSELSEEVEVTEDIRITEETMRK
ncbi:hypothetical protein B0T10DRAFT_464802 [Thelonectria olida]|uniref:Uncharacterized protein n=1 Tax=Thelonectria olida TaxID=1576542 RepID=A0A9P8VTP5_9HYPO|nr:hypothetical protein B0T10DRAFT_464802 [Thelonectria olida]